MRTVKEGDTATFLIQDLGLALAAKMRPPTEGRQKVQK